tara:strand:- start:6236 stop:7294 length:1059 start_codon:yes stop_codon:yes gene_type:complete
MLSDNIFKYADSNYQSNFLKTSKKYSFMRDLATIAMNHWGINDSKPELIKFRENAIFKVFFNNSSPAVIRIHRSGYHSNIELQSELSWMRSVVEIGIKAPQVIPAINGQDIIPIRYGPSGETWQVDVLSWIDGDPVGILEGNGINDALNQPLWVYEEIGNLTASLHNHTSNWKKPDFFERHSWNLESILGEDPIWGRFWELKTLTISEKKLLLHASSKARENLCSYITSSENYGLIHADLIPENILVNKGSIRLIDFDDCGFGWHLFDLATITFFFYGEPQFNCIKDAVLRGYQQKRKLPDKTIENCLLFHLIRGFTYLGWIQTRADSESAQLLAPEFIRLTCLIAEEYLTT